MYNKILVALDGSTYSDYAIDTALKIADCSKSEKLYGCHIYASKLHRVRFMEMETGLPDTYQTEEKLSYLRETHEDLITDGMQLISDAYLSPMVEKAIEYDIKVEGITPEGRNYSKLIEVIQKLKPDLVVIGGWGHGKENDNMIGSITQRILLNNLNSDIMIVKRPMNFKYNPIVVGIDGSENSFNAFEKSLEFAQNFNTSLDSVAVYDPYFHTGVFHTIAEVLPPEQQKKFNFTAQEKLHDEIIDNGLEKLYLEGLLKAEIMANEKNMEINKEVLKGKVYKKILDYCNLKNSDLLVLGKWGLHKEDISLIGSHTFNCATLCDCNLLIVQPSGKKMKIPKLERENVQPMKWTSEAEKLIINIPAVAKKMAKRAIEDKAREKGFAEVIPELVQEVAESFGMQLGTNSQSMSNSDEFTSMKPERKQITNEVSVKQKGNIPVATSVKFHKAKKLAPSFHKNILKSKVMGQTLEVGQKILVFVVKEIKPNSPALIDETTIIEFD